MADGCRNKTKRIFSIATMTLALTTAAHAGVLFDQSPTVSSNAFDIINFRIADSFILTGGGDTLESINFWYAVAPTVGSINDLAAVTYAIYANNANAPGSLIFSETIASGSVTRSDASSVCATCNEASFNLSVNPALANLAAGTYWLELHAGNTLNDTSNPAVVDWATVAANANPPAHWDQGAGVEPDSSLQNFGGSNTFEQYAFQISGTTGTTGTTVPEPGTIRLILLGAGALVVRSRAKRA